MQMEWLPLVLFIQGGHNLEARKTIDNVLFSAYQFIDVMSDVDVELNLSPPPNVYRKVTIQGGMYVFDDDFPPVFDPDDEGTLPISREVRLNPFNKTSDRIDFELCVDGEVLGRLWLDLELQPDNVTVYVNGELELYEDDGNDNVCDGSRERWEPVNFTLFEDQELRGGLWEVNDEGELKIIESYSTVRWNSNRVEIAFTIVNEQQ